MNDVNHDEPELRFPEFNEKWNVKTIKSVAQVIGGGTPKTDNAQYWDGEINWFTPSEIGNKYIFDSERKITGEGLKKSSAKLLPINSILLSTRATIGETSIIKKESTTNQGFQSLVVKENYNYEFIYYLIQLLKNEMLKRSSGSTFLEISKKEVEKILIKTPNLDEQNKIAQFLSVIDKKIELLEKKLVLCRKTIDSNLRKIYSDLEEYDEIKLKDIVKSYASNLSINKLEENIGEYPLYGAEGIIKYVDFYEMKSPYISIIKDGAGVGRLNLCNEFSSALGTLQCLIPKQDININVLYSISISL